MQQPTNLIKNKNTKNKYSVKSVVKKPQKIPLHIIISVFNEEKAILKVLDKIQNTLKNLHPYKITVIDDGSSDNTYNILKNSDYNLNSKIYLQKNDTNLGKGYTLKRGFQNQNIDKNEIIIFIDGDGEHPPEEIPRLIQPIIEGKADVVIGSRFLHLANLNKDLWKKGSYLKNKKPFSQFRKIGNKIISFLIYLFYNSRVTDSQCGFRAFAPGIASKFEPNYSGFEVETEMTLFYLKNGYKLIEVPIDTGLSSRESHMNIISDSLRILLVILDMKSTKGYCPLLHHIFPRFFNKNNLSYKPVLGPKVSIKSERAIKKDYNYSYSYTKKDISTAIKFPSQYKNKNKKRKSLKISFIIPCYNESKTIKDVIDKIHALQFQNYEVIIIDDGSKIKLDTAHFNNKNDKKNKKKNKKNKNNNNIHNQKHIAKNYSKNKNNVKIYHHKYNQGYGKTILDGIKKSSGDIIVTLDSDGQHQPADLNHLINPILKGTADIVIGSRYAGKFHYEIPILNRFGEALIESLLKFLFHIEIKNNQAGFRVFHRRTLDLFDEINFLI